MKATEAKATVTSVRVTPRKCRLVIDLVRGKDVKVALGILANTNKSATPIVDKLIRSAAANAINNHEYLPRAKGSASGLVKRTAHITVVVKER